MTDNFSRLFFENQTFMHPELSDETGLVGVSFELHYEDLLAAYRFGIFPVNDPGDPIGWWSPDPRWILDPLEVKISKSMKKFIRDSTWKITCDQDFEKVMRLCGEGRKRKDQHPSWITEEVIAEYYRFYDSGRGHSFEVRDESNDIIGGFYGIVTGNIFAGESMFANKPNASKYAFIIACGFLSSIGIKTIDCQMHSYHLESLGAYPVERLVYLELIKRNGFEISELIGNWSERFDTYLNK